MQTAEKLTPTFVIKLILLFALLLTGVFERSSQMGMPANAKNVQHYEQAPSSNPVSYNKQVKQNPYIKLVRQIKDCKPAIEM